MLRCTVVSERLVFVPDPELAIAVDTLTEGRVAAAIDKRWRAEVWRPYERWLEREGGGPRWQVMNLAAPGGPRACTFVFDETFLGQALDCYAAAGWPGLAQLQRLIATLHATETKQFVGRTLLAVAGAVADEIWRVETVVAAEARAEWQAAIATATRHLARFTRVAEPSDPELTNMLSDRKLADAVFEKCVKFSAKQRRYRKLGEKLQDRVRHEGSARKLGYVRTGYELLWFELYAAPQREVWAEMAALMHELDALFPPAVLVLERMEPDLDRPPGIWTTAAKRQHQVEQLMYDTLIQLRQIATEQLATLSQLGLSRHATAAVAAMRERPIELPRAGVEGAIIEAGLHAPAEANRVLMDAALLRRVVDRMSVEPSWRGVVARRYTLALEAELDHVRANAEAWDKFWGVITWATAMLSLLALMAVFPFGTAAAPALIAALTFAGTVAAALTIVVMIHEIIGTIAATEQTADELRFEVFRLAQHDPLALYDVAFTLSRSDKLRAALTTDLLKTLVALAVASKIKLLALALELDGFLSDVEDLFYPLELLP